MIVILDLISGKKKRRPEQSKQNKASTGLVYQWSFSFTPKGIRDGRGFGEPLPFTQSPLFPRLPHIFPTPLVTLNFGDGRGLWCIKLDNKNCNFTSTWT
jgi:hypothetical protein